MGIIETVKEHKVLPSLDKFGEKIKNSQLWSIILGINIERFVYIWNDTKLSRHHSVTQDHHNSCRDLTPREYRNSRSKDWITQIIKIQFIFHMLMSQKECRVT